MLAQAKGVLGSAFKKMSQRAMWRGDRGQSQMLESHGMAGMRSNLLRDTPTYKKEAIGLNQNGFNFLKKAKAAASTNATSTNVDDRNKNINTKVTNTNASSNINTSKGLGGSILDSIQ